MQELIILNWNLSDAEVEMPGLIHLYWNGSAAGLEIQELIP